MGLKSLEEVFAKFEEMEPEIAIYCDSRYDPECPNIILIEDVDLVDSETNKQMIQLLAQYNTNTNQWRFPEYNIQQWFDKIEDAKRLRDIYYHLEQIRRLSTI
jgi:hypothetical protein